MSEQAMYERERITHVVRVEPDRDSAVLLVAQSPLGSEHDDHRKHRVQVVLADSERIEAGVHRDLGVSELRLDPDDGLADNRHDRTDHDRSDQLHENVIITDDGIRVIEPTCRNKRHDFSLR